MEPEQSKLPAIFIGRIPIQFHLMMQCYFVPSPRHIIRFAVLAQRPRLVAVSLLLADTMYFAQNEERTEPFE